MAEEILVNVTSREVRVALVENGILREVYIDRSSHPSVLGNIYKGRVHRVVAGIQAAFVDIGFERAAFLHISDIHTTVPGTDIRELLRQGQEILVQVYKDALGSKGVRVTTQFTLPARYLVLTPGIEEIAVSQRITDESTRERLLKILSPANGNGYIFRTAAMTATSEAIAIDKAFLETAWHTVLARSREAKIGDCIYNEQPIALRLLRDIASDTIDKVRVDQAHIVQEMREFARHHAPKLVERIAYHAGPQPIFDINRVETQLQEALRRKVYLKSGGYLIFDQTEAIVAIDVNSGSYLGHGNPDETIFKINQEAVDVIAQQVRLRNLGGIIIIDFIDMSHPEHKIELLERLRLAFSKDSVKTEVSELTSLGLVQMTRKRTRESLERVLCVPCPVCQHRGTIKSPETISNELFRAQQEKE
ncbi:MAG: ribonuclease [Gammaproteobacteria bacterium]|jgi:ribonuclease G|nr:ribonuclease [Gammaproteobacteria bacterium]